MKINAPKRSIKTKILGIVLLSIFLVTATLGFLSFEFSKRRLVSMLGDSIKGIAGTIASSVKQQDLSIILANSAQIRERYLAASSPSYSHLYEKRSDVQSGPQDQALEDATRIYARYTNLLLSIKTVNKIESPINIYVPDKNRLRILLTSDPVLLMGAFYAIRPEAESAISIGLPQATDIYSDKDGMWISAYAPVPSADIKDNKALIEINYKINTYMARLRQELGIILLVCLIGFLGAALISYNLVTRLVSAIKRLDETAKELEKEHYDNPIDVKSNDEIGHLAMTFERLRLSIREKIEELRLSLVREKRAHLESIVALTNAIEMRDPYTRQHLYRVEKYALLIAKAMRLSREEIEKLKYSCFLHDIGKIYIETSLLQKVKLSTEDFTEIKKHSERGAKIIEGIQFLTDVKDAVLSHQEHYDGKGYPNGLKGKEIPLLARIMLVADAFDAMTTNRPYREKMSFKNAMKELEKNAGTQFDPDVCKAFLKYRDTIEAIAKKHFEYP